MIHLPFGYFKTKVVICLDLKQISLKHCFKKWRLSTPHGDLNKGVCVTLLSEKVIHIIQLTCVQLTPDVLRFFQVEDAAVFSPSPSSETIHQSPLSQTSSDVRLFNFLHNCSIVSSCHVPACSSAASVQCHVGLTVSSSKANKGSLKELKLLPNSIHFLNHQPSSMSASNPGTISTVSFISVSFIHCNIFLLFLYLLA